MATSNISSMSAPEVVEHYARLSMEDLLDNYHDHYLSDAEKHFVDEHQKYLMGFDVRKFVASLKTICGHSLANYYVVIDTILEEQMSEKDHHMMDDCIYYKHPIAIICEYMLRQFRGYTGKLRTSYDTLFTVQFYEEVMNHVYEKDAESLKEVYHEKLLQIIRRYNNEDEHDIDIHPLPF